MREGGKEEEEEVRGRNSGRVKEGQKTGKAERNHYPGLHPSLCGYSGLRMQLYKTTHCHAQDCQGRKEFKIHVEQGSQGVLFVDKMPSEFSNKTY